MVKISVPDDVEKIIEILERNGFEAYIVGGCVRDSLMGRLPKDWDITTSASPQEVKQCFRRTIDTGIAHGTVTVMMGQTGYEVTTYRLDGEYTDSRHPSSVTFTRALSEDLKRRDFTINAMAYNEAAGLADLFGGMEDLENGLIRAVGDPAERFSEDALRIMRAVRFSAQLDFTIEENTLAAAAALSSNLEKISKERIREELVKTLESAHPERTALFEDIGAMPWIFPAFGKRRQERIKKLSEMPPDRLLRLAAFLEGCTKEEAETVLRELKFDNDTLKRTAALIEYGAKEISSDETAVRKLLSSFGTEDIERLLLFSGHEELKPIVKRILTRGDCISLKTLALGGRELGELGLKPGKTMGEILKALLERVLEDPGLNSEEKLTPIARELIKKTEERK